MSRVVIFSAMMITSFVVWEKPIREALSLALSDERYTYILLIVPLALALVGIGKRNWWPLRSTNLPAVAMLPLSALLAYCVSRVPALSSDVKLALEIACLAAWWIGAFVVCFGVDAARDERFALWFSFLAAPLPILPMQGIVAVLQWGSAFATEGVFRLLFVPVARQGTTLTIPGLEINIASECSSIRSSLFLFIATLLMAQLFLRSNWKKTFLVALVLPVTIAKNAWRIATIGWLATHVDESFLAGRLHRSGGVLFYLGALLVIVLVLVWLRRREAPEGVGAGMRGLLARSKAAVPR